MAKPGCWVCGGFGLMWLINGRTYSRCECVCETAARKKQETIESLRCKIDALTKANAALHNNNITLDVTHSSAPPETD